MAAAAVDAATGTGAGTRRAVVRSERFMEWQREISRSVTAVRRAGHTGALVTAERHSSDDENAKALGHEGSEGRDVEGEGAAGESQGGADVAGANEGGGNLKGKKTQQQQRQRSDAKKGRKEEEGEEKKSVASSGKDGAAGREGEGGQDETVQAAGEPGKRGETGGRSGGDAAAVGATAGSEEAATATTAVDASEGRRGARAAVVDEESRERGHGCGDEGGANEQQQRSHEAVEASGSACGERGACTTAVEAAEAAPDSDAEGDPGGLAEHDGAQVQRQAEEVDAGGAGSGVVHGSDMPVIDSISERAAMTSCERRVVSRESGDDQGREVASKAATIFGVSESGRVKWGEELHGTAGRDRRADWSRLHSLGKQRKRLFEPPALRGEAFCTIVGNNNG